MHYICSLASCLLLALVVVVVKLYPDTSLTFFFFFTFVLKASFYFFFYGKNVFAFEFDRHIFGKSRKFLILKCNVCHTVRQMSRVLLFKCHEDFTFSQFVMSVNSRQKCYFKKFSTFKFFILFFNNCWWICNFCVRDKVAIIYEGACVCGGCADNIAKLLSFALFLIYTRGATFAAYINFHTATNNALFSPISY